MQAFGAASGTGSIGSAAMQSFGSGYYRVQEQMLTNALAVKSNSGGPFDFECLGLAFHLSEFRPALALYGGAALRLPPNGKDVRYDGTYWTCST